MDSFAKLSEYFMRFPGVGSRQAKRFVYHLLTQDQASLEHFARLIESVKQDIRQCEMCYRYYNGANKERGLCETCASPSTDKTVLMIVEKDVDVENVVKSGAFAGRFFVLGGTIPLVAKKVMPTLRIQELQAEVKRAAQEDGLKELVCAFSANPEGEHTREMILNKLSDSLKTHDVKATTLGRGLSTGTELEYSDEDTLKSAFNNRY